MKKLLTIALLLINSIMSAQCPDQIQDQGNNNAAVVVLNFYDASGVLLGTCTCNLAGSSGNLNCPSTCAFSIPGTGFNTVTMGDCTYTNGGVLIAPLPIELINFSCSSQTDNITISWITATETNNQEFQLLRSIDGIEWVKIATLIGAGTTTQEQSYEFIDYFPPENVYYYKLIQEDYDGKETPSGIISCSYKEDPGTIVTYYNNLNQVVSIDDATPGLYIKEYSNGIHLRREVFYKQ